jgi:hypothetical protein
LLWKFFKFGSKADIWQVNWFKAVSAPLGTAIVAADCATMDGDKGKSKSKRAKIKKEKPVKVVTVQDTSKVELEVETVEPLSLEAEAANAMDVEVKKLVDSASIDTVAVSSGEC